MAGLLQPQTTSSSPRTGGRFPSGKLHPQWLDSLEPEMVGRRFGMVEIISTEILKKKNWTHYVKVRCVGCGVVKWICKENLFRGKTKGCQSCSQRISKNSGVLGKRYHALVSRCTNPRNPGFKRYGAREIRCLFSNAKEFILWVEENLPHPDYAGVEIDRVDNGGHYAPGNLRLASKKLNNSNKRNTKYATYAGKPIPSSYAYDVVRAIDPNVKYARRTVVNLVRTGLSVEEIIHRYYNTPSCKPKGCTILPTPDPDAVSLFLDDSSTTASLRLDTAAE